MSVREYIGARYVPLFMGEWDNNNTYEPLSIVTYQGNSYTSRQFVPIGANITDTAYWALTGNYNAQVEAYRQEVLQFGSRIDDIEDVLPVNEFSSVNTVDARFNSLEELLPSSSFDNVNTVDARFNSLKDTVDARFDSLEELLPSSAFDNVNTVNARFDAIESDNWVTTNRIADNAVTPDKMSNYGTVPNFEVVDRFDYGSVNNAENVTGAQAGCVFTQDGTRYWAQIMNSSTVSNDKLIIRNIDNHTQVKTLTGQFGHGYTLSYNPTTKQLLTQDTESSPQSLLIFNVSSPSNAYLESTLPLTDISIDNACWYDATHIIGANGLEWNVYDLSLNLTDTFTQNTHGYSMRHGYIFQNICWDPQHNMAYFGTTEPDGIIFCNVDFTAKTITMSDFLPCKQYYRYIYMRELEFACREGDIMYINQFDNVDDRLLVTLLAWNMVDGTIPDENSKFIQPSGNLGFTINYSTGSIMPHTSSEGSTYKYAGDAINEAKATSESSRAYIIFAEDYPNIVNVKSAKIAVQCEKAVTVKGFNVSNADVLWAPAHLITVNPSVQISGTNYAGFRAAMSNVLVTTTNNNQFCGLSNPDSIANAYGVYMENTKLMDLKETNNYGSTDWFRWCELVVASASCLSNATVFNCFKGYRTT